jgi:hypothetical protein
MDIKLKIKSHQKSTNNFHDNQLNLIISGKDVNYVIINTLRRLVMSSIPIYAFHHDDMRFDTNTSIFNNDMLKDRFRNIPIFNIDNLETTIDNFDDLETNKNRITDQVNNLTMYGEKEANSKKGRENMPGHVRAALNYNYLRKVNGDQYSQKIVDGMKVIVCKLKSNPLGFTSVAYPTDELRLPAWFTELPFDDDEMEKTLVDEKIDNLLGVLSWDIRTSTNTKSTFDDLFTFG